MLTLKISANRGEINGNPVNLNNKHDATNVAAMLKRAISQ